MQRSLHQRKKEFTRMISELEKKAAGAVSDDIMAEIEDMVKEKEGIERKLSTTYSLGRDSTPSGGHLLPLHNSRPKSHSFQSSTKESVTFFHTLSSDASPSSSPLEASDEDDGSSWSSWSGDEEEAEETMVSGDHGKGKGPLEGGGSGSPLMASGGSASKEYVNPLFVGKRGVVEFGGWGGGSEIEEEGLEGSHDRIELKK